MKNIRNLKLNIDIFIKDISKTDSMDFNTLLWTTIPESFRRFGNIQCKCGRDTAKIPVSKIFKIAGYPSRYQVTEWIP